MDWRLPAPGSVITCRYKGEELQVLAEGFAFEGEVYASIRVMSIFDLYLQHEALLPVV